MAKLGHTKRVERATALAMRFIDNRNHPWTVEDATRVACIQYDIHPNLIIGIITDYAANRNA